MGLRAASMMVPLAHVVLAGCIAGPSAPPPDASGLPADWLAGVPDTRAIRVGEAWFTVLAEGREVRLEALHWLPGGPARTAVVLVHGFSATHASYFRPLPERGADVGALHAHHGRAAFAVNMPGYGGSDDLAAPTYEAYGHILAQVADALRAGAYATTLGAPSPYEAVVGQGTSMGGAVVDLAAGAHGALDAIVPGGAAKTGFSQAFKDCSDGEPPCPEGIPYDFWLPGADLEVAEASVRLYEPPTGTVGSTLPYFVFLQPCMAGLVVGLPDPACDAPTPWHAHAANVRVPVLSLLGREDFAFDNATYEREPENYPQSPDARVAILPETGHAVQIHLNMAEVAAMVDAFLDEHAL